MGLLSKRTALITGAGGAIGRASALAFAREGARLALLDVREDPLAETVELVQAEGGSVLSFPCDVGEERGVAAAVAAAGQQLDGLDILFPNAGIMPHEDTGVLDFDEKLWLAMYRTNVLGTAFVLKHGIPHLLRRGGGSVVTMSSFVAIMGSANPQEGYGATKGAIVALTKSMAVQFGPQNIRVNALLPGPILTDHVEKFFPTAEARQARLQRIPLGRFGRPEDVASAALFLASDASAWITGQTIILDGGISSHYI